MSVRIMTIAGLLAALTAFSAAAQDASSLFEDPSEALRNRIEATQSTPALSQPAPIQPAPAMNLDHAPTIAPIAPDAAGARSGSAVMIDPAAIDRAAANAAADAERTASRGAQTIWERVNAYAKQYQAPAWAPAILLFGLPLLLVWLMLEWIVRRFTRRKQAGYAEAYPAERGMEAQEPQPDAESEMAADWRARLDATAPPRKPNLDRLRASIRADWPRRSDDHQEEEAPHQPYYMPQTPAQSFDSRDDGQRPEDRFAGAQPQEDQLPLQQAAAYDEDDEPLLPAAPVERMRPRFAPQRPEPQAPAKGDGDMLLDAVTDRLKSAPRPKYDAPEQLEYPLSASDLAARAGRLKAAAAQRRERSVQSQEKSQNNAVSPRAETKQSGGGDVLDLLERLGNDRQTRRPAERRAPETDAVLDLIDPFELSDVPARRDPPKRATETGSELTADEILDRIKALSRIDD